MSTQPPDYDVVIAGSGPIACTYARVILDKKPNAKILMIEIGSQENLTKGGNLKNALKYRKDIDSFVNVIKGHLQPVSIPPEESYVATLGGTSWHPPQGSVHQFHGCNPAQQSHNNLRASAITRTVGGMATHWTCCCPKPSEKEERAVGATVIDSTDFNLLFKEAGELLSVNSDAFNGTNSIRHKAVMKALKSFGAENLPLAVKVTDGNVIWTGSDTILGNKAEGFTLKTECRVTKLVPSATDKKIVDHVVVHNYANTTNPDEKITAKAFVIACGAICTPQILWNSADTTDDKWTKKMRPEPLGRYLSEQSVAFCQVVLSKEIIDGIWPEYPNGKIDEEYQNFEAVVKKHQEKYPNDKLPIPFDDYDPQVYLKYCDEEKHPWHAQVHRDAFPYGDVGPKADPRVVVDLRFFGKSDVKKENRIVFEKKSSVENSEHLRDTYGMPQPTFEVTRSDGDKERDQRMMEEMCKVATKLGGYLPGSYPQLMEPGLALHLTGTTRMGKSATDSVVDSYSQVHGVDNLWLGGNGVIPDSTACHPTRTSIAYAIRGANALAETLD